MDTHQNGIHSIALRIVQDVEMIQHSCEWQSIGAQLVAIQRAAREIEQLTRAGITGEETTAGQIAKGYLEALGQNIEGVALLASQLTAEQLLQPQTISLCETLCTISAGIQHNYVKAANEAQKEWEQIVSEAEAEISPGMHHVPVRPLNCDGDQDTVEEAA